MRSIATCLLVLLALLTSASELYIDKSEPVLEKDVPANVRNSFNRIYIDHDPEVWYVEVIKPKGGKKTKRYTAQYSNKGRSHLVRFDDVGMPVGEYYVLNERMSNHVAEQLFEDYPDYTIEKVESLWMFKEGLSVFKVQLMRKSKSEVIFVDDNGLQVINEVLITEFAQG